MGALERAKCKDIRAPIQITDSADFKDQGGGSTLV